MSAALILRCANIENTRAFYERRLGVTFQREQHGAGPIHFSAMQGELLIEIYPADDRHPAGQTDLMLPNRTDTAGVELDPDGRRIVSLR